MKRKAEITFEVEETIILRQAAQISKRFCRQCGALVEMASPQTLADFSPLSEREIFRLVEAGKIHFIEAERIFICLNSFQQFAIAQNINPPNESVECLKLGD